ncbi:MAG TPA: AAA family ATPase [Caulobacteraceae bacterium]|nr:AAA family ATPase [Caulobacteraceae bacterium]
MADRQKGSEVAQFAQRRQLTVLFCDLVDSTALASRLDPEDTADVYRDFRDACAAIIEAAGGYVAKYMGDGVMAYFGYPTAHEDDAERAVHAAVGLVRGAAELRTSPDVRLAARVGIATGLVVVGDLVGERSSEARDVVGETPNLAARLQAAAAPNEILVSNHTRRLAAGLFTFEDGGRPPLKGIKLESSVWRVVGARLVPDRFRARQPVARAPMMGREAELETLFEVWRACQGGGVRIVGIVGEAGIGKSRLADEFHRAIASRTPHIWLEGGGVQLFSNTPFYPVAQAIHRRLSDGRPLGPDELLQRLAHSLALVGIGDDALALIAELIDAAPPDAGPPIAGEQRRRALIGALADWLVRSATRWPTVLAIQDLQWVDPSTVEFLEELIARAAQARLLILYTARPDTPAAWATAETRITLRPLDRESARNLVTATAASALAPDLLERIVSRAGGVPLFAEELALLVGDEAREAPAAIPSALSDLLMARLDQVGPAKELAQMVAVLGDDAPLPLLGAVAGLGEAELAAALDRLVAADLLVAHEANGRRSYAFRHALIQTAAYETLLRQPRRGLHKRAAEAMREQLPELAERHPEVLAQHWLKAGEHREAVAAWRRAAAVATARHALREALYAAEQGIAVIGSLQASAELERDEIYLQNLVVNAAGGVEGYASPRVLAAIERSKRLAEQHGGVAEALQRALGEWAARSSRGDYRGAAEPGDRYVQLARSEGGEGALACAQMILLTRYRQGDLASAEAAFRAGESYFQHHEFLRQAGAAPQVYGSAATVAWLLGLGEEATRRSDLSLELCKAIGPYDLAYARHMAAQLHVLRGDATKAERLASENILVAVANGYGPLASLTRITLGRALAALGSAREGAALIEAALFGPGVRGARGSQTLYLTWFAEALVAAGDAEGAGRALEEALGVNPGETYFRPETLRVRGDLARARGRVDDAEADYQAAVALARSMGAAALAQRAMSSLAGLRGSQGRRDGRGTVGA